MRRSMLLPGIVAAAMVLGGCSSGSTTSSVNAAEFTPEAQAGREVAKDAGCMSCHGGEGQGGVGPTWQGLAGSTVQLGDGTTTVADRAYLVRAILDPGAEKVEGYAVAMPVAGLDEAQAQSIVDYIEALK